MLYKLFLRGIENHINELTPTIKSTYFTMGLITGMRWLISDQTQSINKVDKKFTS